MLGYGRAGTTMPAWGIKGGGPMNDQQVDNLVSYLESITLDEKEVKDKNQAEFGTDGRKLFEGFCAQCHTHGAPYGEPGPPGGGAFGPALSGGATLRQFPDPKLHIEWVGETAEYGKQYGVRGIAKGVMPHFGRMLSPEQIQAIVDYERGL